jgi:hypothetical protein
MMTRAEALAGAVQMILDRMPAVDRHQIMQTPGLLEEMVLEVERLVQETGDAAQLNGMTMEQFMKAYGQGLRGQIGHA